MGKKEKDLQPEFLAKALDAEHMLGVFRAALGHSARQDPRSVLVRVLRFKPGRAHGVVEYTVKDSGGSELGRYIGKVFEKRRRADRLHRALDAAQKHLGSSSPAPLPLAHVPEDALVLMHVLAGEPLVEVLTGPSEKDATDSIRLAALALAALHSVPMQEGKPGSMEDEIDCVRRDASEFPPCDRALAAEAHEFLGKVEELARHLPAPAAPSLTHGSFRPTEVLVAPDRASILDLDGWAMGDPALDVGYYLADLWWLSSEEGFERIRPYGDRFLEQYVAVANRAGLFERAILYEVFAYARLSLKKLRKDSDEARSVAAQILAQAGARIGRLAS